MAPVTLLRTEALTRAFGGLNAVEDVDLAIESGEVRGLIGPNGAGKSTLVGLIAGRLPPTRGRILLDGRDVTALPDHRRVHLGIAYTFQVTSIFGRLTVDENLRLAAEGRGLAGAVERADRAIADTGLAPLRHRAAGTLAYGHQRLVEIAMGLALEPRLLILDEPTQGLSDREIDDVVALVRRLAGSATILLIEHNMAVVMDLSDRITVMDRGRILAEGSPAEIRGNPAVREAYLGH